MNTINTETEITFKKTDMTFISDNDLFAIKIALDRYRKDIVKRKLGYPDYISKLQVIATDRMIKLFDENAGFLAVPFFPIDID